METKLSIFEKHISETDSDMKYYSSFLFLKHFYVDFEINLPITPRMFYPLYILLCHIFEYKEYSVQIA